MTIYLDSDFVCHLMNDDTMQVVKTDVFDGQVDEYIKGYHYVPAGQTWVREDGAEFKDLMVASAKNYDRIFTDIVINYFDNNQAEIMTVFFDRWQNKSVTQLYFSKGSCVD